MNHGMPPGAKVHFFQGGPMNFQQAMQKPIPILKHINIKISQVLTGATVPLEIERWLMEHGIKVFEIGANTTNSVVQDTLTINAVSANGTIGLPDQVLTSDGTGTYWGPLSDGHGFYRGNNGEKPPGVLINRENIFRVNSNTIVTDITFLTGENATATGPIEIVSGITLTVQQNSRVVII
jgi:hypothetical protein